MDCTRTIKSFTRDWSPCQVLNNDLISEALGKGHADGKTKVLLIRRRHA